MGIVYGGDRRESCMGEGEGKKMIGAVSSRTVRRGGRCGSSRSRRCDLHVKEQLMMNLRGGASIFSCSVCVEVCTRRLSSSSEGNMQRRPYSYARSMVIFEQQNPRQIYRTQKFGQAPHHNPPQSTDRERAPSEETPQNDPTSLNNCSSSSPPPDIVSSSSLPKNPPAPVSSPTSRIMSSSSEKKKGKKPPTPAETNHRPRSQVPFVQKLLDDNPHFSLAHKEKDSFESLRTSFREIGVYATPYYWRNWMENESTSVDPDLDVAEDQVLTRVRTWNRFPERMLSVAVQSQLHDILSQLGDVTTQLHTLYSVLSEDRGATVALLDILGSYDSAEQRRKILRRQRRRKFQHEYWWKRLHFVEKRGVFTEWRRVVQYARDVEVLKAYIERSKEAVERAHEAVQMHEYLTAVKKKLDEVVQPALDAKIAECEGWRFEVEAILYRLSRAKTEKMHSSKMSDLTGVVRQYAGVLGQSYVELDTDGKYYMGSVTAGVTGSSMRTVVVY